MATAAKTNTYVWEGTDRQGRSTKGESAGTNPAIVKAVLRKQGITPKTVKKKAKPLFSSTKPITPSDISIFTRQLATMMKAGVPLVQAFEIVADGLENPSMRDLVNEIKNDVSAGSGFASSIRKHPKNFDDLFCNLIDSGEQSGTLETMLERVATYKEKSEALKAKIKKALTYPIAVIVVAAIVTGILLIKVVPQFATTFAGFGADLPSFTLFVLYLSELAQAYWLIFIIVVIIAAFAFKQAREKSKAFVYLTDRMLLKVPIVGDIIYNSIIARFSRTLSTTFAAGVPLVDALEAVSGTAGNVLYRDAIIGIRNDVTTGTQLHAAIKSTDMFPNMMLQLVTIGEQSGALDEMLDKAAQYYEDAVDNMVDGLTALLEPLIMSVLGVLVGGLMIAMYLPIFMLGAVV